MPSLIQFVCTQRLGITWPRPKWRSKRCVWSSNMFLVVVVGPMRHRHNMAFGAIKIAKRENATDTSALITRNLCTSRCRFTHLQLFICQKQFLWLSLCYHFSCQTERQQWRGEALNVSMSGRKHTHIYTCVYICK